MDKERRSPRSEELEQPTPSLSVDLARRFVAGTFLEGAPMMTKGDKSEVYLLHVEDVIISGIDHVKLLVDYRKYHEPTPERTHQMRFEYVRADAADPKIQEVIAQMHLGVVNDHTFALEHRHVAPDYRTRSGVGTTLLKTAEGWVQQVADVAHHPVVVRLQTGQESVIRWIEKMGYVVQEDQRALLEEMSEHPERFFQDEVYVSPESKAKGIVKDRYTFRVGTESRYMEDAVRLTFQKYFQNRV